MKLKVLYSLFLFLPLLSHGQEIEEFIRFSARNATQAVAVDSQYIYTISNSRIEKHTKTGGESVAHWEGPLKHLNSGVILNDLLYCAHTNFPETPMASSIEIFDPKSMEHVGTHSFGMFVGSCTWLDWYEGHWYVMFVHYDEKGKERDLDASYTTLLQFDEAWRRTAGWTIPDSLVDHLRPMSISGGFMMEDGYLYASPHHFDELYVLRIPRMGFALEWVRTIQVPMLGQGIARDPQEQSHMYGIHRKNREVIGIAVDDK